MIDLTRRQINCALLRVEDGLNQYIALQNDLHEINVSTDRDYQKRFNSFYRVRRNAAWQNHYYKLLQKHKSKGITFNDALRAMHKKTGMIEASFVSKLVATINPEYPVIDQFVLANAGLKLPYSGARDRESKICGVYEELRRRIEAFLKTNNGKYLVRKFEDSYPDAKITAIKMVDLVLWQSRPIVLISCVSQKLPHRAKAKVLYVSTLFKLSLKYAESLRPDEIYILSAKHGLLRLGKEIEPYEQTLNNMRSDEIKEWANHVVQQLKKVASLENTEFIFLAGDKYRKHILPHMSHATVPLKGLRIGEQLQRLKELTA